MFEQLASTVLDVIDYQTTKTIRHVKRQVLLFVLKALFLVLSISILSVGIILLGSKYVGADLMLLIVGFALFLAFFVIK